MHCGDGLRLLLQGYANPGQLAAGIHTRLYARAYLIADPEDTQYVFELHALSLSFISVLRRKQSLNLRLSLPVSAGSDSYLSIQMHAWQLRESQ